MIKATCLSFPWNKDRGLLAADLVSCVSSSWHILNHSGGRGRPFLGCDGTGEEAAWLPSLTARILQMKHFSSPGNPLSQALAMTTDTPAGRRQRPCHVIEIVLLTQASFSDPHSWVREWCGERRGLCLGCGSALRGERERSWDSSLKSGGEFQAA